MVSLLSMYAAAGSIPWARCKHQPCLIIAGGLLGRATCGKSPPRRRQKRPRAAEILVSFTPRYEIS